MPFTAIYSKENKTGPSTFSRNSHQMEDTLEDICTASLISRPLRNVMVGPFQNDAKHCQDNKEQSHACGTLPRWQPGRLSSLTVIS